MSAELNFYFWMVMLCAPGVVPAVIFYRRHCKERPRGENRFPLGLYVVALLICAFMAFWGSTGWGVSFACSGPSSGNLCGLLPFLVVGPLSSIIAVSVLSWLITNFPLQMKRLVLTVLSQGVSSRGHMRRRDFIMLLGGAVAATRVRSRPALTKSFDPLPPIADRSTSQINLR